VTVVMQCPCGEALGTLKYADLNGLSLGELPPFDETAHETHTSAMWKAAQARRDLLYQTGQDASPRDGGFWAKYDEYLNSPAWLEKRELVLRRDAGRCRAKLPGCRGAATEVHHLRYTHVGREPLFDLESVCRHCHRDLTTMDRSGRKVEQIWPTYEPLRDQESL